MKRNGAELDVGLRLVAGAREILAENCPGGVLVAGGVVGGDKLPLGRRVSRVSDLTRAERDFRRDEGLFRGKVVPTNVIGQTQEEKNIEEDNNAYSVMTCFFE